MAKYQGLFLHVCGQLFCLSNADGKFVFRQTSFMSSPKTTCPRCSQKLSVNDFTREDFSSKNLQNVHLTNASGHDTVQSASTERA